LPGNFCQSSPFSLSFSLSSFFSKARLRPIGAGYIRFVDPTAWVRLRRPPLTARLSLDRASKRIVDLLYQPEVLSGTMTFRWAQ